MKKFWVLLALIFSFVTEARADKILLINGDLVKGTVEQVEGDILTLSTGYSDPLKLRIGKIKNIATDKPVVIHLTTGEILKGKILSGKDGKLRVEDSKGRGRVTLDWARVKAINPPPNKWKGDISVGGSLQSGNTERLTSSIGFKTKRKFDDDRFEFKFLFNYAEENDKVTARNTYGSMKLDHFFTPKWYGYLGVEMLSDKFKDLNLRTIIGPGVGYQVWDDPKKSLGVEGGFSYFSEDLKNGVDDRWVTARVAGNLEYHFTDSLVFSNDFTVFPSTENFGDYILRNEAAVTTSLMAGWHLKLSNILEQNNNPPARVEETDLTWILALGYAF